MREIGVRALRQELSEVLERARAGETGVGTRDGVPIAKIVPAQSPLPPPLEGLIRSGRATWGGGRLSLGEPQPLVGSGPTVTEILLAQRQGDDLPG